LNKRAKIEQTSDGEDLHTSPSPRLSSSLSPGSSTECRSPSPFSLAPKKRFKIDALKDINHEEIKKSPFRPWMDDSSKNVIKSEPPALIPAGLYHPYLLFLQHPKALELTETFKQQNLSTFGRTPSHPEPEQKEPLALVINKKPIEQPVKKIGEQISDKVKKETNISQTNELKDNQRLNETNNKQKGQTGKQRNYKNMTRERRVEANARERQRVQTITEQFDTLRSVIPIEDKCAKMSKLSIIKIATSYITYLGRQCGYDYTPDKCEPTIEECYVNLKNLIKYESKINSGSPGSSNENSSTHNTD